MDLSETIAKRIQDLCAEQSITVNKLSTICGITQSTIDYAIKTKNSKTSVSTVKKICDGLNITLADFFNTEDFNSLEQEIK
ncbi:MAG: helix-turn-helix transcriptional regulator [Oscillospiraceae bacterium]|nr:helix-turn-helix transcriptional regulator [Oscillospiraceae bacterium]